MQPRQDDAHGIGAMLSRRLGANADITQLAAFAVSIWHEVDAVLSPIFDETGVVALYKKSLDLTIDHHPCLATAHEQAHSTGKFAGLGAALSKQTAEYASAVIVYLLNTFHDLLTHLIGGSMFERLLRSIWDKPSGDDALQNGSS